MFKGFVLSESLQDPMILNDFEKIYVKNEKIVYVALPGKVFEIPREKDWQSEEYKKMKIYAIENGVEEKYLKFWIED